jgi:hypothetical protein
LYDNLFMKSVWFFSQISASTASSRFNKFLKPSQQAPTAHEMRHFAMLRSIYCHKPKTTFFSFWPILCGAPGRRAIFACVVDRAVSKSSICGGAPGRPAIVARVVDGAVSKSSICGGAPGRRAIFARIVDTAVSKSSICCGAPGRRAIFARIDRFNFLSRPVGTLGKY